MENNFFVRFWVTRPMRDFHVTLGVVAVLSHVIGGLSKNPSLPVFGDIVALFGIFHYFIHGYFYRQQQFLINNMKTYSLPKKKIARIGSGFLGGFMLVVCMGMTVVREIYTGTLLAKLKVLALYLLKTVLTALFGTDGLGREDMIIQNDYDLIGAMGSVAQKEESAWESLINTIQTILIIIGLIMIVVLIIVFAVNAVRNALGKMGISVKKNVGKETSDREESLRGPAVRRDKLLDFSANAKIRRIYRKVINRQRRKGQVLPEWMTPAEIESHVAIPDNPQARQLHEIYEKARYSESGASDEEARQIGKLVV